MKTRQKRKKTGISLWPVSAGLIILFGAASPCFATGQSKDADRNVAVSTRTIEGRVVSAQGAAVPQAVVLLKDGKTLQVRSYIAQADGSYHFFGLSTEVNYTLRAETKDLTSKIKAVSVFDSKAKVVLDLRLTQKIKHYKN